MPTAGPPSLPLRAVAALFLARQHLDRPRQRRFSERNLIKFASDTGGIQIDSINVIERAHYLTAWSRFGPYDRRTFDRLVYRRRVLFEYWAHAACLVPSAHFSSWRRAMLDYSRRHRGWGRWLQKNRALVEQIEAAIESGGPLGSADFAHQGPRRAGGWWNWKPAAHALDYLWMSGRTLVHSRLHFQKRFDLAERLMADALAREPLDAEEFRRWHLRQSLHALGAATATDLRMYLTFPRAEVTQRRRVLSELLASGEVVRVEVDDAPRATRRGTVWFALAGDVSALTAAARRRVASRGTTLLTPFDSFLWHRERTQRLFGFDYKIEVYTPGHKRVHGYYVLPILHDGQLIGRVDAKLHRVQRILEVKAIHFEPWFARGQPAPVVTWAALDRDRALAGLTEALQSLAIFVGAEHVKLQRVSPARFSAPLKRALRLPPTAASRFAWC